MRIKKAFSFGVIACLVSTVTCYAEEFRGRITKIDPAKKEIVVEGRGGARGLALGFAVNADTKILFGRESAKLEDLQPGDRVRLHYENRNNQRVALSITDLSLLPRLPAAGNAPPEKAPAPNAPAERAPAANAPPLAPNTIAGRMVRVGLTEREIVVISPGTQGAKETETTLLIPANVKISKDQKPLKLEDLKEGEQVTVRTEKRDGHLVAAEIQTGGVASAAMPQPATPPSNPRIEKIRQVLKVADWILQQMEEQKGEPK
jgi:Cu/Ag efflux protein CusF